MEKRKKAPRRPGMLVLPFIAATLLFFWHFRIQALTAIGNYLVVSTGVEACDAAVILSGNMPERAMAAADLYREGLVSKLVLTRGRLAPAFTELIENGFPLPEEKDLGTTILTHAGIPQERISILPGFVDSTIEEARAIARFAAGENLEKLIVVTSSFHTRRVSLTLKHALGALETEVFIHPSPYSEFDPHEWWRHRRMAKELFIEYQKLVFYMASTITNFI